MSLWYGLLIQGSKGKGIMIQPQESVDHVTIPAQLNSHGLSLGFKRAATERTAKELIFQEAFNLPWTFLSQTHLPTVQSQGGKRRKQAIVSDSMFWEL